MNRSSVRISGSVFANQKYGGVSRYLVELASALPLATEWSAHIESPLYINEYLRASRKRLSHRGLFLPWRPRGLDAANRRSARAVSWLSGRDCSVIHEASFRWQNLHKENKGRVSTFYDMIHERFMPDERNTYTKRRTAELSDCCIAISECTKNDMVHYLGIDPDKIVVIHLASDMEKSSDPVSGITDTPFLLWVGGRSGYKNFFSLAKALPCSRVWRDGRVKLVCAGGPAFSKRELEFIHQAGLDTSRLTHLRASEKDLSSLYSNAELLVYISLYEGFGIPPLEAMRCDCPVVASACGSVPEVVGNAARTVQPDEVDSIAAAIDTVLESAGVQEDLVRLGRLRASNFSWSKCAEETASVYDSVAER